jgi:hypothetical protein
MANRPTTNPTPRQGTTGMTTPSPTGAKRNPTPKRRTSSLPGSTVDWTFDDGPTKDQAFQHTFGTDGRVTWTMPGAPSKTGAGESEATYQSVGFEGGEVVTYLAPSGWTLTSVLLHDTGRIIAVASNQDDVIVQQGTFQVEGGGPRAGHVRPKPGTRAGVRSKGSAGASTKPNRTATGWTAKRSTSRTSTAKAASGRRAR